MPASKLPLTLRWGGLLRCPDSMIEVDARLEELAEDGSRHGTPPEGVEQETEGLSFYVVYLSAVCPVVAPRQLPWISGGTNELHIAHIRNKRKQCNSRDHCNY